MKANKNNFCGLFFDINFIFCSSHSLGSKSTEGEILVITVSLGCFLFESGFIVCHQEQKSTVMIWHHIFSVLGFATFLYIGKSGAEVCTVTFGAEITNPLVLLRWLMRDANCKNMYVVPLELIFAGTFVIFRIIFGSYFLYCGILNPKLDWVIKLFGLALYFVSWAFVVEIFGYHAKKIFFTQQNVTKSRVQSDKKA